MPDDNRVLVTVLLHHDQLKTLAEKAWGEPVAATLEKDHAS